MQKAEENAAISNDVNTDTMEPLENINPNARTTPGKDAGSEKQPVLKNKIHIKKSITDYLFDFIMLFLAVTAGFFVENVREKYAERSREKQYIASLIRDLAADTLSMNEIIANTKNQVKALDTLLQVFEKPRTKQFTVDIYHYTFQSLNTTSFFEYANGTITQLKNAGGLRLIRQDVADSITQYYTLADNIKVNNDFGLEQFKKVLDLEKSIFNLKILRSAVYLQVLSRTPNKNITFLSDDPKLLDRFYNEVFIFMAMLDGCNRLLIGLKPKAVDLIQFLKQSYNLE